ENGPGRLEFGTGFTGETRKISLRASERRERIEIFDDPAAAPGYTGYQRLTTRRGTFEGETALGDGDRLQLLLGLEENFRREFADADATDITLGLLVNTASGFLHYHHRPVGPFSGGTIGVFALDSRFEKRGTTSLIPNSRSQNA